MATASGVRSSWTTSWRRRCLLTAALLEAVEHAVEAVGEARRARPARLVPARSTVPGPSTRSTTSVRCCTGRRRRPAASQASPAAGTKATPRATSTHTKRVARARRWADTATVLSCCTWTTTIWLPTCTRRVSVRGGVRGRAGWPAGSRRRPRGRPRPRRGRSCRSPAAPARPAAAAAEQLRAQQLRTQPCRGLPLRHADARRR